MPAAHKYVTAAVKHGTLFTCNYDPTQTFAGKASITVTMNETEKQTKIHQKTQTLYKAFRGNLSKIRFNLQSPQGIPPKGMLVHCGYTTLYLLSYTMRLINNAQERLKHLAVLEKPINRMMGGCSLILMETPLVKDLSFSKTDHASVSPFVSTYDPRFPGRAEFEHQFQMQEGIRACRDQTQASWLFTAWLCIFSSRAFPTSSVWIPGQQEEVGQGAASGIGERTQNPGSGESQLMEMPDHRR